MAAGCQAERDGPNRRPAASTIGTSVSPIKAYEEST
jgi:hypothetical protein